MRYFILLIACLLISCQRETPVTSPLPACADREYTTGSTLTNEEGTVRQSKHADPATGQPMYYLDRPGVSLHACNLPDSAKVNGLKIRFTGQLLSFPGMETLNMEALPFRLLTYQKQ